MIPEKDFYHGAVLAAITESDNFSSINKVPHLTKHSSHAYLLNHNTGIFVKHTTTKINGAWKFTFPPDHQSAVRQLFDAYKEKTFVVFVCENEAICIINFGIFASCIDLNFIESEWLEIWRPDGGSFRVRGKSGEHGKTVPLNAFPKVLFE